jgi:predicted ATPase with chaperone activity
MGVCAMPAACFPWQRWRATKALGASSSPRATQHAASLQEHLTCNADMRPAEVRQFCQLDDTCRALMRTAMNQLQLSARPYHRLL